MKKSLIVASCLGAVASLAVIGAASASVLQSTAEKGMFATTVVAEVPAGMNFTYANTEVKKLESTAAKTAPVAKQEAAQEASAKMTVAYMKVNDVAVAGEVSYQQGTLAANKTDQMVLAKNDAATPTTMGESNGWALATEAKTPDGNGYIAHEKAVGNTVVVKANGQYANDSYVNDATPFGNSSPSIVAT